MTTHLSRTELRRRLRVTTALAGGALIAASPGLAQTVPTGPTPAAGNPTITSTPSPTPGAIDMDVSLDQDRTIINWTSFDIGQDDSVNFRDGFSAGANALAVLNRDLSGNMSQIDGSLLSDANVAVYLLNTNGITFGAGANVNVGALVASTLDLTDADFLDGASYNFTGTGTAGIDIAGGTINGAMAVSFLGHFVNQAGGTVTGGNVAFVAASDVTMANEPGSPLGLTINQGTEVAAPIVVGGTVNGQNVYVGMATKSTVTDAVLSISGVVTATTATATDRGIVLAAGTSATGVTVNGGGDTGGNAKVSITGSLSAGDGGTAANSASVEIRGLNAISSAGSVTAADNVSLSTVSGDLTVTGALSATGGNIDLTAGGTGNIDLQAGVTTGTAAGQSVTLVAGGGIGQNASGVITTGTLLASGGGAVALAAAANDVVTLDSSNGVGFSYADANDLVVTGLISGVTGDVSLAAGAGAGDSLDLQNAIVNTSAGGDISLGGAAITLDTAYVSAAPLAPPTAADGDVTFNAPVTVAAGTTALVEGDTVHFTGPVSGATGILNVAVATGALVDADISLGELLVDGGPTTFGGNSILTASNLTLEDLILAGAGPASLTASSGAATLTVGAISDADTTANALTLTSGGSIVASDIGSISNPIGALTLNGSTQLAGSIVSSGAVTFTDPLVLTDGDHSITGASTSFGGTVNGTNSGLSNLVVTATATTNQFAASVGNTVRLGTLTIDGDTAFNGGAGTVVNTTGAQNFNGNLTFAPGTKTFSSSGNDTIRFNGALNGGGDVTVSTGGDTIFEGTVGAGTALASLTTDGGGTTAINGGSVNTTGAQTFSDNVTLTAATTLASSGNEAITLGGTVGGAQDLAVNTGGTTTFGGTVSIASLATDAGGTTAINGGAVMTTGDQAYGDAVTLGADTTLAGATGTFASTVTGNGNDLALNFTGTTVIDGDFTGIGSLSSGGGGTTELSGTITTAGAQSFTDNVTLKGATTLASSGNAAITLAGTVGGAQDLVVNTGGTTTFGGAVSIASLATNAGGTTALNGGTVTTTGNQTYGDAVTLGADTVLTGTDGSFAAAITGAGNDLTLSFSGTTTLGAGASGIGALISDGGGTTILNGTISTGAGGQNYSDAVTLGSNVILASSGGGAITLGGTVGGAQALTVNTTGATTLGGAVNIASLTTNAGGSTAINGGTVTTSGAQSYGDPVTLGAATTLASAGAGNIAFAGTVTGAQSLAVNTAGTTSFGGSVSIAALTTDAGGSTQVNGGSVTTTGNQSYNDNVSIDESTTFSGVDGSFAGTLTGTGTSDLTLSFSGATSLQSVSSIEDLLSDGGGTTLLNGNVSTSGGQNYADAVTLGADVTLARSGNGAITLASTVGGAQALTVNTGGTTTFGGAVSIAALTTDAGGTTAINGGSITTTGNQAYGDAVTLGADTTLTGATGTFASTVTGNGNDLALNFSGTTVIDDDFTGIDNLSSGGGGTTELSGLITTTGAQNFADNVTLTADTALTSSGNAAITLGGTVGGAQALTVNTGGTTTLGGAVSIAALTTDAGGTTAINGGAVTTTGDQTYGDAVTLGADTTLAGATGTFASTVTGNGNDLTLNFSGTTVIDGNFTGIEDLASGGGGTTELSGLITTTGSQNFTDDVTLTADTTLTSSGNGAITLGGTVDGAQALTVNTGGTTTFGDIIDIASLATDAGGTTAINGGIVTTSAGQDYGDNVTLRDATTLVSSGGDTIALGGTVTGAQALTVITTGTTRFDGSVSIASLATDAGGTTEINGGSVTTTGAQTYNDDISLGDAATLSGTDGTFQALAGNGNDLTLAFTGAIDIADDFTDLDDLVASGASIAFAGQTLSGAGSATLTSSGVVGDGTIAFDGDVSVSGSNVALTSVSSTNGDVTLNAAGDLIVTDLAAGDDASLTAGGNLTLNNPAEVVDDLALTADDFFGVALTGPFAATFGDDLTITDTAGGLVLGPLTAPGTLSVVVQAGGNLDVIGTLTSINENIALATSGGGGIALGADLITSPDPGRQVSLISSGTIAQSTMFAIFSHTLTGSSVGGTTLESAGNVIAVLDGFTNSGSGGFSLVDSTALTVTAPVDAGPGSLSITSAGLDFTDQTLTAGMDATLSAGANALTGGTVVAGGSIVATAGSIDIGTATASAGSLTLNASAGDLMLGIGTAGMAADLDATGTVTVATSLIAGGAVTIDAGPLADLGLVRSTGSGITVNADAIDAGTAQAQGGALILTADNGSLTLGTGTASGAAMLQTTGVSGDVTVSTSLSAGDDATIMSAGNALLASVSSTAGNVDITATAGAVTGIGGGNANLSAGENVTVTAGSLARLGTVGAGASIGVTADAISVDSASTGTGSLSLVADAGSVTLGTGDIADTATLTATDDVSVATILNSGGTITLTAGDMASAGSLVSDNGGVFVSAAAIDIGNANAAEMLDLEASAGDLMLGTGMAGMAADLDATGEVEVTTSLIAGGAITIDAGGLADLGLIRSTGSSVTVFADAIDADTVQAQGGALMLTADNGNLTLGSGTASTTATLQTTGGAGDVQVTTSLASGEAAMISSVGDARLGSVSATTGNVVVTAAAGEVTGVNGGNANLAANGMDADVLVTGGTLARLGTISADRSIDVTADTISVDSATTADGLLSLVADAGSVSLGSGVIGTTATLTATDDITVSTLNAGGTISLTAGGVANAGSLVSTGGDVTVGAAAIGIGNADASGLLDLAAGAGNITLGTGRAGTTADLDATGNLTVTTSLIAGGMVTIDAGGLADLNLVRSTGSGVTVDAGTIDATTVEAQGGALMLTASAGDLTLGTGFAATSAMLDTSGDARLGSVTAGNGSLAVIAADEATGLLPTDRANLSASGADSDVTVTAGTLALLGTVSAADAVTVAADAVDISSATATGGALTLSADMGRLILGTGTAGAEAMLTKQGATGELQVTMLTAVDAATLDSSTHARLGNVTSGGALRVTAAGQVTGIPDGSARANLTAQADMSDITVSAGTLARLGEVNAGNDVRVTASNGTVDITNAVARTGLLTLSATNGDIMLGTGTAATISDLTTSGSGDINVVTSLISGGTITIGSADDVTIGLGRSTSGDIVVDAADAIVATTVDAGGLIDVDGASIDIGSATAGSSLTLRARTGQLTLDTGTAGTAISLTKEGNSGELQAGSLDADDNVDIESSTHARLDTIDSATGSVAIMAAGDVTGIGTDARTDIAADGDGANVAIDAGGLARLDVVSAGDSIAIDAASIDANDVSAADGTLAMTARSGQLTLGSGSSGDSATIIKQGGTGELVLTSLDAGGTATLTSATSLRVQDVVSRGGDVVVTAAGELTGVGEEARANLTAQADAGDVTVSAGTNVLAGNVAAGNDVNVVAANGSIDIVAAAARTGLLALTATNGDILLDTAAAGTTADLTTNGSGSITIATSLIAGGDVTLGSADDATMTLVQSGGNVGITAVDAVQAGTVTAAGLLDATGNSIAAGSASAGTTLAMTARTDGLVLGTGTAGGTATLTKEGSTGELQVTSLAAGGTATLTSSTSQRLGAIASSGGDAIVTAANSVTGLAAGTDFTGADLSANGRVQLRAGSAGLVRLSDVAATMGDVDLQAGTAATATSRVDVLDSVSAGGAYRIAAGSISLGGDAGAETQAAAGAVSLTALSGAITGGTGLTLQSNSDGSGTEGVAITANGSAGNVAFAADSRILGGTTGVGSNVAIDTVGGATLGQVTASGQTIAISSNDIEVQGATATDLSPRVTAGTVTITNRADVSGVTRLGNDAGSGGFAMSQAEVNRIGAATVTIESGSQDVAIGNLALATGVGSGRLNLQGVSRFDVTGAVSADGSASTRTIQIGGHAADAVTNANIRQATVIRVASTPDAGGRLLMGEANLDLRGAKIGVGQDQAFLMAIGLLPGGSPLGLDEVAQQFISNPNSTLYAAATPYTSVQILTASSLMVTYSNYALFQNTGIAFVPPSGVSIASLGTNGTLDLVSSGNDAPNGFSLFGTINGREGNEAALLGPEVIILTDTNRNNTRINGCTVGSGGGGCLITAVGTPNVAVFDERQANILNTAEDLELPFDPIVGTNNEALFTGISSIDEMMDEPEMDCAAEPDSPECRDDQSATEGEAGEPETEDEQ